MAFRLFKQLFFSSVICRPQAEEAQVGMPGQFFVVWDDYVDAEGSSGWRY